MVNEAEIKKAKQIYNSLCSFLDENHLVYDRDDENLCTDFGFKGDDVPIHLIMKISPDSQFITLCSFLPFEMDINMPVENALAVCFVNNILLQGNFDLDMSDGSIYFRLVTSFIDSLIDKSVFHNMIQTALNTVETYNDQFDSLRKKEITLAEFIKKNK